MIGFEGRLQWRRHKLFKLRARRVQCKNAMIYKALLDGRATRPSWDTHLKFAIRLFLVRRTRNKHELRRHCEERQRRSNPALTHRFWIASLRSQ
jgi:hypothetical protein